MIGIYLTYTFAFLNPCYFLHYSKELSSVNLKVEVTVFLFVKFKEHLKFKNDLYYVLNKKTEDYLFYGEDNNVNEFISIYQSLIRLQYDLLNSVSKNVRQNFLLK